MLSNPFATLLTPEVGAQTQLHCATDPGCQGGRYYVRCAVAEPSDEAKDTVAGARLWERTMAWIAKLTRE